MSGRQKRETCPHCGQLMPRKDSGPFELYLAGALTYGATHPVKVGIAKDAVKRVKSIDRIDTMPVALRYVFRLDSEKRARQIEFAVKKRFPRCRWVTELHTEVLDVDIKSALAFVREMVPDIEPKDMKPEWRGL